MKPNARYLTKSEIKALNKKLRNAKTVAIKVFHQTRKKMKKLEIYTLDWSERC